jgi:hypothetical protein
MPPSWWLQQNHLGTIDAVGWGHPPHQFIGTQLKAALNATPKVAITILTITKMTYRTSDGVRTR